MPILQISPDAARIAAPDQEIEELGNGYHIAEGPLWWQEEGYLLFNEVRNQQSLNL